MQDTKNLIFAIVLSTVILFSWQYFYAGPKLHEVQKQAQLAAKVNKSKPVINVSKEINVAEPAMAEPMQVAKVQHIRINTGKLHGSISTKGVRFDDLKLADYKQTSDPDSDEVVLLSKSGSEKVYFAEFGWAAENSSTAVPNSKTVWHTEDKELREDHPVVFSWDNNAGLKFFVNIELDEDYLFKITRSVRNYGSVTESVLPYGILNRTRDSSKENFYISHEGPLGVFDGVLSEVTFSDLKDDKKFEYKNSKGWLGVTDKYWLTALIPDQKSSFDTNYKYFMRDNQDRYQVDYLGQKLEVVPGDRVQTSSYFFAGPKKVGMLDDYGQKLGIELFDRAVDFGWLYFITKPIFKLLTFFYHLLGNFGLAILLLTVVLKVLLFPLANKSYVSMHHLKRLQPQIADLKERYKNDKTALNKAIMELYKEEKVNPMAGCLPLVVQIPIFFALYKVLFVTIEMRQAPFYGWINDLSMPDPTSIFNLFGLLPFDPPMVLMIGVWPLIMGLTMYLQQKMNPKPADPMQAKIMSALPFIFIFLFATFPAGLIIYWAWNNTLSILQQWFITRRLPS